ncbi:MAG: penicillin-binding protein [Nitrospirota bacterium]|nr:penicillin-binding protein [Nitrospirota bacterium]
MKKKIILTGLAALALLLLAVGAWIMAVLSDLPDVALLKQYRPAAASEVLDRNGAIITHFYDRTFRVWTPITAVPDRVIRAVVTAEDDTFFGHGGVNYKAVWEALQHDVRKKRFARGGSTITQQMIKNVLLSKEKTIKRKVREFVLARQAEDLLTKRQILEIYLNEVEWGAGIHGIEAASRYYFDKHVAELSAAQTALLAGMLPNPKYYDPFKRPDKSRQRQEQVLFNMFQAKQMTEEEYRAALQEPLKLRDASSTRFDFARLSGGERPCSQKVLERVLIDTYGEQALYRKGLRITTTLDRSLQNGFTSTLVTGQTGTIDVPDSLLVLQEGNEIRAISCSGTEEDARFFINTVNTPSTAYEVMSLPASAITGERLILPETQSP